MINAGVLTAMVLFFYLALRELGTPRFFALIVPLVYGTLPHYSTNRFWFSSFAYVLSMALYFLSLYCNLRALNARSGRAWGWVLLGLIGLLGSTLAMELTLPLFFLNLGLVAYVALRPSSSVDRSESRAGFGRLVTLLVTNFTFLIAVITFKVQTMIRFGAVQDCCNTSTI